MQEQKSYYGREVGEVGVEQETKDNKKMAFLKKIFENPDRYLKNSILALGLVSSLFLGGCKDIEDAKRMILPNTSNKKDSLSRESAREAAKEFLPIEVRAIQGNLGVGYNYENKRYEFFSDSNLDYMIERHFSNLGGPPVKKPFGEVFREPTSDYEFTTKKPTITIKELADELAGKFFDYAKSENKYCRLVELTSTQANGEIIRLKRYDTEEMIDKLSKEIYQIILQEREKKVKELNNKKIEFNKDEPLGTDIGLSIDGKDNVYLTEKSDGTYRVSIHDLGRILNLVMDRYEALNSNKTKITLLDFEVTGAIIIRHQKPNYKLRGEK